MSKQEMAKYKIKEIREFNGDKLIISVDGDEWLLKPSLELQHRDNRNSRGNVTFHFQLRVKSFQHCLNYIARHTEKYIAPRRKVSRLEYLFSII